MSELEVVEQHRRAQIQVAARASREIATAWNLLDPYNIDATIEQWLQVTIGIANKWRDVSTRLGATHYVQLRTESKVTAPMPDRIAPVDPDVAKFTTDLTVNGPIAIKDATAQEGGFVVGAASLAGRKVLGVAVSQVLNGGRGAILNRFRADRAAIGVARVTSGKPCAFCAMLASRGAVYKDESVQSGGFDPHKNCKCQPMTIYRKGTTLPANNTELQALWNESTQGLGGKNAMNAFRRALGNN